jgi:hypothetical protein
MPAEWLWAVAILVVGAILTVLLSSIPERVVEWRRNVWETDSDGTIPEEDEVERAWKKANAAWEAAGSPIPCTDPTYLEARANLSKAIQNAEAASRHSK